MIWACRVFTAIGVLAVAALPAAFAGSGGADARQATPVPGFTTLLEAVDEPYAATPSGEQILRIAGQVDPILSLDPALARDYSSAFLARQLFRGLVHLDRDLEVRAELASRVEVSEDGLVYRFTIREGATFHDGAPVTADDVVGSLARSLDPDTADGDVSLLSGPSYLSDIVGAADVVSNRTDSLAGAVAIDERTVEIRLLSPRSTFLMKLSTSPGLIVDVSQSSADREWWRRPNGSGPFRLAEWTPDERLVLTPFNTFVAGVPVLQRVEMRLGPPAANAFNLYQSGQIDIATAPVSALDRLLDPEEGVPEQITITPIFSVSFIALDARTPPFDDPAIREALARSFPREQLAEVTFAGRKLAADGLIPPGMLGRDWPVAGVGYDIAAARAALARSRYDIEEIPPIRIYGSGPFAAEVLRDSVRESLGLEIEVISRKWPDLAVGLARRELPAFEFMWIADYPDPETFLWSLFAPDSADNYSGYDDPEFARLLDRAANTLDPDERAEFYVAAQQLLFDDHVLIPVVHDVRYTLSRPAVRNLEVTPLGIMELDSIWMER